MKHSTDVEWRSDSLAVISSRDINQFTYVRTSLTNNAYQKNDDSIVNKTVRIFHYITNLTYGPLTPLRIFVWHTMQGTFFSAPDKDMSQLLNDGRVY